MSPFTKTSALNEASPPKYSLEFPEMSPLIKTSLLNEASPPKYKFGIPRNVSADKNILIK